MFIGAAGNRAVARPWKADALSSSCKLSGTTEGRTEVRGTVSRGRKTLHDTQQQKARHTLRIEAWRITTKLLTAAWSQDVLRGRPGRSFRAVHFGGCE